MKRPVILTILMYLILPNILRGVKVRDKNVNYRLTLQKIVIVDVDEVVFKDTYVNLVNKRNSPSVFTLYGTLTKPLNEIWFHLNVFYKYKYYREFLIKGDGEFCALVSGQAKNPIYDNLMLPLVMEKHSYFIHDCPYFGEVGIYNFTVDNAIMLLLPIPSGQYRLNYRISDGSNKTILYLHIFFDIQAIEVLRLPQRRL